MKTFEEICASYNRSCEEVESDLFAVLREIAGTKRSNLLDIDYKEELKLCLVGRHCILKDTDGSYEITKEGQRVLQREWITEDYKSLNNKKKEDRLIKYITLAAVVITAIATMLTAFLTIFI